MRRPKIFFNSIDYETEREHIEYIKNTLDDFEHDFVKANASFDMEIRDLKWYDAEQRIDALTSINNSRYCLNNKFNDSKTLIGSPYFARIDYADKNNTKNIVYVSKGNIKSVLNDYDDVKYVNWRSPIAGLLYKYNYSPIRKAEFNTDSSVRSVDIELVAKIKINYWMLDDIAYSSLAESGGSNQKQIKSAINQELQDKLAARSSDKMSEIVDTIQSDQYDIIKQDFERDLIIQGCAGSGKTAVALHRIAYLLYNGLESQEILFISPNKDFSNYISNVLPELGEVNILIKTLDELYHDVFNDSLLPKSFDTIIENYLTSKEKDRRINLFFDKDDDVDKVVRRHIEHARERRLVLDKYFECLNQIKKTPHISVIKESKLGLASPDSVWNNDNKIGTGVSFDILIGESVDFTFYAIIDAIVKKTILS